MKRTSVLLIISCSIGLFTASIYASRIQHLRDDINRSAEKVSVLAVTRKIMAGETIGIGDLTEIRVLKGQRSGRSITPENLELITGRQVIHPVPANDPILWTDFPEGPRVRFPSEKIPPGYRVIALPADEIHTLSHFIQPGDKVDIVSSTFAGSKNLLVSSLIAEDIEILSVGHRLEGISSGADLEEFPVSISILVLPQSALAILRAAQTGEIHFLARGAGRWPQEYSQTIPADSNTSFTGEKP